MSRLSLLRPVRGVLLVAMGLQALAAGLALLPLLALIAFTQAWLTGGPTPALGVVLAAVTGTVGAALGAAAATWLTHRADARLAWILQRRLADVIRRAPLPAVAGQGAARLRKVVQDDTAALHYVVAHTLLDATGFVVTPCVGLTALTVVDWRLAAVSLLPLLLGVGWYVRAMRGSAANFAEYAVQQQRVGRMVVDYVRGLPVAKIYGGDSGPRARYIAAIHGFHDFFRAWSRATAAATTASWLFVAPAVVAALLALVGGRGLLSGGVTPAALAAGVLLGPAIAAPVAVAGPRFQAVRTGLAALASITELLDQPQLAWGETDPPPCRAPVGLGGVTVRYGDRVALDQVTFTLPDRGLVALVGASGSGKSTIVSLLARFADPDEGRVLIGDADLGSLRESDLYQRLSFAFQDTGMRHTSIRDALTGGRTVAEERMTLAATEAAIHDDIVALPRGYDTLLGGDIDLSGGQRQRLALARALLRDADVLVLDETLSHLDPVTRADVLRTLRSHAQDCTVLLMAHQLHLVQDADRILVLDQGRLVGDGIHADLLDHCAAYRALWVAQDAVGDGEES